MVRDSSPQGPSANRNGDVDSHTLNSNLFRLSKDRNMIQRSALPAHPAPPSLAGGCRQLFAEMSHLFLYQPLLLLVGDTGVGKAHLARYLCAQQSGPDSVLQEINCRLQPTALQAWLSATADQAANSPAEPPANGRGLCTLLLREIEGLSLTDQQGLLQRIETNSLDYPPSQRFVFTSRTDLPEAVRRHEFRDDLYYRLSMFCFEIPPLRDRTSEIPRLIRQFAREYAAKYHKSIERIEDSLIRQLTVYPWPGNIRQLQHVIERAVIFSQHATLSPELLPADLFPQQAAPATQEDFVRSNASDASSSNTTSAETPSPTALGASVADTERTQIEQALQRNLQSRTRAARELGISRVTLYNKMKKLGLETQKTQES